MVALGGRSGRRVRALAGEHRWALLAGLLLVGLVLRVGLVLDSSPYPLAGDAWDYDRHARVLLDTHRYPSTWDGPDGGPTASRPPLYPFFLAAVYGVVGQSHGVEAARLVQAALGTAIVGLIGLIAWQLWGRPVALIAIAMGAVFPPLISVGATLMSEALFLFLELAACAAVLQHRRSAHRLRWAVVAGLLCGLAALTRSVGPALIAPLALLLIGPSGIAPRARLAPALTLLAVTAATVAPWTVRNAIVIDAFVPVSTQGGHTLAGALNASVDRARIDWAWPWELPDFASLYWRPEFRARALAAHTPPGGTPRVWRTDLPEAELERRLTSAAVRWAVHHPARVIKRSAANMTSGFELREPGRVALSLEEDELGEPWLRPWMAYGLYLVLLLAVVGAFTPAARRAPRSLWLVPILFIPVTFLEGMTRLRAPIDPFLILLAAVGAAALVERFRPTGADAV